MHRSTAILTTVSAIKAMQLPAAMSYGPQAAGAWFVIQAVKAIRDRLATMTAAGGHSGGR
jgi:hypothetical protein